MSKVYKTTTSITSAKRPNSITNQPKQSFERNVSQSTPDFQSENERQFTAAVAARLEGPLLRYSKRLELMAMAEKLEISTFQANLLIAQVQQKSDRADEILVRHTLPSDQPNSFRDRFILAGAIFVISALIDMIVIKLFFSK